MPRRTTVGIALVAALLVAGCGDDDTPKTSATVTSATVTTAAGSTTTDEKTDAEATSGGSGTSTGSKSSGAKTSSGTKTSATATSGSAKTSPGSTSSGTKSSSGTKPSGSGGSNDDSGGKSGSVGTTNSREDRSEVVSVVRRYQKAFIDFDGKEACSLLTSAGQKIMTAGGRGQTCPSAVLRVLDQATNDDLELLKTTRDGITTKDVTIRDGKASVDIGKGERLRLVVQNGRWLVSDPNP